MAEAAHRVKQAHGELKVPTRGKGFYDITRDIRKWVAAQAIQNGLLTVFIRHTSASLTIQENADPDVRRDLGEFFERLVPENTPWFRHTTEGSDDMPSHIRAALTSTSVSIPVQKGAIGLGTWQAIYVFEHRSDPEVRHILLHILGD
jgi:secondary thiamine-phosphate synthase enzyme